MKDFIICSKCEALLIIDEFELHECTPNHRFEGDYLYTRRNGRWRRVYLPSLGIYQPKGNTDNTNPRGNRTSFTVLLLSWDMALRVTSRDMTKY